MSEIRISAEQRDALYEVVRAELGSLSDLKAAFAEPDPDLEYLYRHGKRLAYFLRLVVDGLGWGSSTPRSTVKLSVPPEELGPIIGQLRESVISATAGLDREEGTDAELEALGRARMACDELLEGISQFERHRSGGES